MNGSLYTGASGLVLASRRLELAANNLANSSTAAFRPRRAFATTLDNARAGLGGIDSNQAVALGGTWETTTPGALRQTGHELDVALQSDHLLAVRTDDGTRYTRTGALQIGADGRLTDAAGHPLLDSAGDPIAGLSANSRVVSDGRVMEGESELGRLSVVRDPGGVLVRSGGNLLDAAGADDRLQAVDSPELRIGWLEGSGTDPVQELIRLVEAQRSFERLQRVISLTANEINRRAVNDIAGT